MAGPRDPAVREPAVAGNFYPADGPSCDAQARSYLRAPQRAVLGHLAGKALFGALVPHAGWVCSGAIAGSAIAALAAAQSSAPDVVVIFGAVHTPLPLATAALDTHAGWRLPGGVVAIAQELRGQLAGQFFAVDDRFHRQEHAVEVVVPLIQAAFPGTAILPVEVPLIEDAVQIGSEMARQVETMGLRAIMLASSDLTHYGRRFSFVPAGLGVEGESWAMENDLRLLKLVTDFSVERIVPEVTSRQNACGGGAIAAMMSACGTLGANSARLLRHANSNQTLAGIAPPQSDNVVGYAAVVVG